MEHVSELKFKPGSKEENLPGYQPDFPHITLCSQISAFPERISPWHWHRAVELFYVESGTLEYTTPAGVWRFPAGSGGFINANVPHMTTGVPSAPGYRQLLHIFDPTLISGGAGSRIEKNYVLPLIGDTRTEVIPLMQDNPLHADILELLTRSFRILPDTPGCELRIRAALSEIWLRLWELVRPLPDMQAGSGQEAELVKLMILFIQKHYAEKLTVQDVAFAAGVPERTCAALFREQLGCTPRDYLKTYRVRMACHLLRGTQMPMARIAEACGFTSGSNFSLSFREEMGCTPQEYRKQQI